jgi:hypothetical protein
MLRDMWSCLSLKYQVEGGIFFDSSLLEPHNPTLIQRAQHPSKNLTAIKARDTHLAVRHTRIRPDITLRRFLVDFSTTSSSQIRISLPRRINVRRDHTIKRALIGRHS